MVEKWCQKEVNRLNKKGTNKLVQYVGEKVGVKSNLERVGKSYDKKDSMKYGVRDQLVNL